MDLGIRVHLTQMKSAEGTPFQGQMVMGTETHSSS